MVSVQMNSQSSEVEGAQIFLQKLNSPFFETGACLSAEATDCNIELAYTTLL